MAKSAKANISPAKGKLTDAEQVANFMNNPGLAFRDEINAVREIIRKAGGAIGERIKWNAPSYYYKAEDMVTFNAWAKNNVHLVFHHPEIVKIKSALLKGDYKDRRMMYFNDMKEVKEGSKELDRVMKELLQRIDKNKPGK